MNTGRDKIISERAPGRAGAFTLIEIMVTVALLSVIIIGLVAMFSQVRRAFLSSLAQVDVLESGRATADLIARDLEQMAPCYAANGVNFYVQTSASYAQTSGLLVEQMANPADKWSNLIQQVFFVTPAPPSNGVWNAIGYRLQGYDEQNSVGTLYRYYAPGLTSTNQVAARNVTNQTSINGVFPGPFNAVNLTTNYNRIIDGVTQFRILAYQTNGLPYPLTKLNGVIQVRQGGIYPGYENAYAFYSNNVPAYVVVELGVLETAALERYRSFGPGTAAANAYLINHPGAIHIFRQRVPIRSFDPSAIP